MVTKGDGATQSAKGRITGSWVTNGDWVEEEDWSREVWVCRLILLQLPDQSPQLVTGENNNKVLGQYCGYDCL